MIYCIDLDDTICFSVEDDYAHSVPNREAIKKVNELYQAGHTIKLFTGRGTLEGYDWRVFTERQLRQWGVQFHELILGKPNADIFIDDKALNTRDWLGLTPSATVEVLREWGRELWVVNCEEYCGKLLYIPKGATSEYHFHKKKKETFYCLSGQVALLIEGREIILAPLSGPVTLQPKERHSFHGNTNSIILEISTHHSEDDSLMLTKAANG